jgi:hypothetical protein
MDVQVDALGLQVSIAARRSPTAKPIDRLLGIAIGTCEHSNLAAASAQITSETLQPLAGLCRSEVNIPRSYPLIGRAASRSGA